MNSEEYEYKVTEKSFSQEYLLPFIWRPISRFIPPKLTPNTITITGFVFMLMSGVFVWLALRETPYYFLLAALCLIIYMAGDNLDGIHARKTNQSSPLGEFLDHWLDSISFVVINTCCVWVLGLTGWILFLYIVAIISAFFATIWEQHHTGVFYSGFLGTNEALILLGFLYSVLAFCYPHPYFFYQPGKWTIAYAIAVFTIITSFHTAVTCTIRLHKQKKKILALWLEEVVPLLVALSTIFFWSFQGLLGIEYTIIFMLSCNTLLCGRLTIAHVVGKISPYRNRAVLAYAGIGMLLTLKFFEFKEEVFVVYFWLAIVSLWLSIVWDGVRGIQGSQKKAQ